MAVVVLMVVGVSVVGPLSTGAQAQTTPGLAEARAKANEITRQMSNLETELAELDSEIQRLDEQHTEASGNLDNLRDKVREMAIQRYMGVGNEVVFIPGADMNAQGRADAMVGIVTQSDTDAIDEYRAVKDSVDRTSKDLAERKATQADRLKEMKSRQEDLYAELAKLEIIEAERIEAERKAAAEEAKRAADARAREEAQAQAEQLAARQAASRDGRAGGPTTVPAPGGTSTSTSPRPPAPPIASGAWVCPVQGVSTFVNSWGFARASGNRHQGVDMMSPRGTPVVIPVSGTVKIKTGGIGGLQFHLNGDDGNFYYGAHMDSFSGAQGHLPAGTVVGYVGDTGDAKGTGTHLHFEIHPGGWPNAVNPFETVSKYC